MNYLPTIIPLAEFRASISDWIDTLTEVPRPVLVTRKGRGAIVVQSVDSFNDMYELALEAKHLRLAHRVIEEAEEYGLPSAAKIGD